jgi:hypothetical protein
LEYNDHSCAKYIPAWECNDHSRAQYIPSSEYNDASCAQYIPAWEYNDHSRAQYIPSSEYNNRAAAAHMADVTAQPADIQKGARAPRAQFSAPSRKTLSARKSSKRSCRHHAQPA